MRGFKALVAQLFAALLSFWLFKWLPPNYWGLWPLVLVQGCLAAVMAYILRLPLWWLPVQMLFLPAAVALWLVGIPAWVYCVTALLCTLVFWGTIKGDVPLFLSSTEVVAVVEVLMRQEQAHSLVELGAGLGSVIIPLAKYCPDVQLTAVERAPIPWAVCYARRSKFVNLQVLRRSFWEVDLAAFDVAFAFLSPDPMPALALKIKREMRPGTLFISSSFPVPGWQAERIVSIADRRKTKLYCYRLV